MVESLRLKEMDVGVVIEVQDYEIRADEFTSWSKYSGLLLNGMKATEGKQSRDNEDLEDAPDKKTERHGTD